MLIDPFLIIGLSLFFLKIVRRYYYFLFFIVAGIHIYFLNFHLVKDDFYWTFLFMNVFVDALAIIGLEVGLKYLQYEHLTFLETLKKKMFEGNKEKNIFWIAPLVVMAIGIAPMPIGYYTLLRLVVCGCSIYYAYHLYEREDRTYVWIFGFFTVLYNPIMPIYLYEKSLWTVVNVITAFVFILKKDAINEKTKD